MKNICKCKTHVGLQRVDVLFAFLQLELVVVDQPLALPLGLFRRARGRSFQLLVSVLLLFQIKFQAPDLILKIVALFGKTFDSGSENMNEKSMNIKALDSYCHKNVKLVVKKTFSLSY